MLNVRIDGVHPKLDGTYELAAGSFTNRELRTIKQMSGVRVLELAEAFQAGDTDVLVAFAAIALRRAGKQFVDDVLWEAPGGAITFEAGEEADADDPPAEPIAANGSASSAHSGNGSSNGGEPSPVTSSPSPSGIPD